MVCPSGLTSRFIQVPSVKVSSFSWCAPEGLLTSHSFSSSCAIRLLVTRSSNNISRKFIIWLVCMQKF